MLLELRVKNFAIIDELHIQFRDGLNIISGETGSGKSVLLKSLGLLMGDKSSSEMVRTGEQAASIEGFFDLTKRKDILLRLQELGIENDEKQLIVRRVIAQADKSKVYMNGSLSTLSQLREIVSPLVEVTGHSIPLIEITGQHENKNLLARSYHLDLMDHYLGLFPLRQQFHESFDRYRFLSSEVHRLRTESATKAQRLDFLTFQRDEITALDLAPGEDQSIELDIRRMKNISKIGNSLEVIENILSTDEDSVLQRLGAATKRSHELLQLDPSLSGEFEKLSQAQTLINDFLFDTRKAVSSIDFDAEKLEGLEAKLSQLRKLQKKYGPDMGAILQNLVAIENEIQRIEASELDYESHQKEILVLSQRMKIIGEELHEKRKKGATLLVDSVNGELNDLNMKGVSFDVQLEKLNEFRSDGMSLVEFMCRTSPKEPLRPLAKTASGGELSRILLALKRVVGVGQYPRTYLFDEVDAGVSGTTAEKVGRKLRSIAKDQQVICVTHLPQVAAFGNHHYFIEKENRKDRAAMSVSELNSKQKVAEIARLISGEKVTKTSLAHAEELLSQTRV